ncbi:TPA: restriction endonuclease subunit S [Escherichia coli]|nr:restriction endonuclease subunit S [Escherichia coli]
MSELSYLEKLLDGVEVEWKSLGDVVNFQRGRRLVKSQLETRGKYAVYQNSMTPLGYYHEYNVAAQSSFIICAGAAGEIGYSENEFWAADDVHFAITPEYINDRFLFHFLLTQKNKISGQVRRASIPRLSKSVIEKLEFPIPCPDNPEKSLAIQSEIVRILDKFTALTAELTAELNMRKKQYNYYRDQLLSFKESEVEWKTLGEIGHFTRGKRFVKTDMLSEGYPCIHYGEMYTYYNVWTNKTKSFVSHELASKLRVSEYGDVIIVAAGETIEDIGKGTAWLGKSNVVFHDACFSYRCSLNPKYIAYFTRTKIFHDQIKKHISSGKISAINANGLSRVKIPMLSAKEQARIVDILDKFDTLTNSITEGLPREIELRQKQYEYYRDLLFSFPKPETISN